MSTKGIQDSSTNNILDVAPQGEKGGERENQILSPLGAEGLGFRPVPQRGHGNCAQSIRNRPVEHLLGLEVAGQGKANPRIGSLCAGNEGVSGAEVDSDDPNAEAAIERQVGTAYKSCSGDNSERGDATSVSDEMAWNRDNVEASPADSQAFFHSLDHFTNRITRYVDKKLGRETELAEVGQ